MGDVYEHAPGRPQAGPPLLLDAEVLLLLELELAPPAPPVPLLLDVEELEAVPELLDVLPPHPSHVPYVLPSERQTWVPWPPCGQVQAFESPGMHGVPPVVPAVPPPPPHPQKRPRATTPSQARARMRSEW